jgi:manganese transport system ATP-binding protein
MTVGENIAFPLVHHHPELTAKERRRKVEEKLELVELPGVYDRPTSALSGGQRKRAFLARAIAQRASVLLLDEPFNGVDVRTEKLMAELFLQLRRDGRTILISTHDLSHVRDFCDLVVLINKTALAYGETSEVFTPENLELTFGGMPPNLLTGPSSAEEPEP